jgi:hypothetical protein
MTAALGCGGMPCPLSPPPWGSLQTKEETMSYIVIYPKAVVTRQLYKDVPTIAADNEFVWEPDGKEEVWYEVSIRPAALEDMARRAAGNHGQISRAGPLRVRVLKRARIA